MKKIKLLALLVVTTLAFTACSDDKNPTPTNEEEVITTMTITLKPTGGGSDVVFQSKDSDGDGPNPPQFTVGDLAPNTTYNATIVLLNETKNPAENVTTEVLAEAADHQFFYSATGVNATFAYAGNNDTNGNPVGVNFTLTTGAVSNGTITVTLRHEPNKSASGVKGGDITNAGGETDITATFTVKVKAPVAV